MPLCFMLNRILQFCVLVEFWLKMCFASLLLYGGSSWALLHFRMRVYRSPLSHSQHTGLFKRFPFCLVHSELFSLRSGEKYVTPPCSRMGGPLGSPALQGRCKQNFTIKIE